jgi:hypothetical protein
MEVHLVFSLAPDDESQLAPGVLEAIRTVLAGLPVTYTVRVKTNSGSPISQSHRASHADDADGPTRQFTRVRSPRQLPLLSLPDQR